ncbi:hypothetical protein ABMA28_011780 [Loxostege sticticalis]|uniref:Uncharacterized protein n=1 Tax=Loxostege sticticalis TaxID=481309 RepID=A0ABD0TKG9_LOXSC
MLYLILIIQIFIPPLASLSYGYDSSEVVIGNLRRRESIPLHQFGRRFDAQGDYDAKLQYRKTNDIRKDRRFELTQNILREQQLNEKKDILDKYDQALRWITINNEEGLGIGI